MSPKSKSTNKPVKEHILDVASALFYQHGINAVGVDTIIEKAAVAKMSLYRNYKTKNDLILAYLERRDTQWRRWFEETVETYKGTNSEPLLSIFDALQDWTNSPDFRGCAFINTAVETADPTHPAFEISKQHVALVQDFILNQAKIAKYDRPKELATSLMLLVEGAIIMSLVSSESFALKAKQAAKPIIKNHKK